MADSVSLQKARAARKFGIGSDGTIHGFRGCLSDKNAVKFLRTLDNRLLAMWWKCLGHNTYENIPKKSDPASTYPRRVSPKRMADVMYSEQKAYLLYRLRYIIEAQADLVGRTAEKQKLGLLNEAIPEGTGTYQDVTDYLPEMKASTRKMKAMVKNLEIHLYGLDGNPPELDEILDPKEKVEEA